MSRFTIVEGLRLAIARLRTHRYRVSPYGALFCIILQRGSPPCYRKASNPSLSGVALLKSFMEMDTFAHTADIGYFIDPEHTGKGLGKQFLAELEKHARELGIKVLVANVSSANPESIAFHERTGFTKCGELPNVGKKKGESFGILWYCKSLA